MPPPFSGSSELTDHGSAGRRAGRAAAHRTARCACRRQRPRQILCLVAGVISPGSGSERTDRLRKVGEYARLGIPQYWIVEHTPRLSVQVLTLAEGAYTAVPTVL